MTDGRLSGKMAVLGDGEMAQRFKTILVLGEPMPSSSSTESYKHCAHKITQADTHK